MSPKALKTTAIAVVLVTVIATTVPVWASMFGEENVTLASILAELIDSAGTLSDISQTAGKIADTSKRIIDTYERVNAGIDELRSYSWSRFMDDFEHDSERRYPGFAKLAEARSGFDRWRGSYTTSSVSAYEAISAVAADVSAPLRKDLAEHQGNIDRELILAEEAAAGFAAAGVGDDASSKVSDEVARLRDGAKDASPGKAQQIAAQAAVVGLAEQSHTMALLSRLVRLESTVAAVEYGNRIAARNALYDSHEVVAEFSDAALKPPAMLEFEP